MHKTISFILDIICGSCISLTLDFNVSNFIWFILLFKRRVFFFFHFYYKIYNSSWKNEGTFSLNSVSSKNHFNFKYLSFAIFDRSLFGNFCGFGKFNRVSCNYFDHFIFKDFKNKQKIVGLWQRYLCLSVCTEFWGLIMPRKRQKNIAKIGKSFLKKHIEQSNAQHGNTNNNIEGLY